ncbi:MAG: hypothetical protein B7Y48_03700 [Methylophilales bacterium 28-44-11]|nr:MAG: hypothetical protein B7Y48_03700 [Methylophilales bacterium 28-44-11]OYY96254.1 MAG: hypothetical protein B7Y32_07325 [Methylophilales bacterium 16-45-7]
MAGGAGTADKLLSVSPLVLFGSPEIVIIGSCLFLSRPPPPPPPPPAPPKPPADPPPPDTALGTMSATTASFKS